MSQDSNVRFSFSELEKHLGSRSFYTMMFNLIVLSLFFIQAVRAYVPGVYVAMFHVVFGHNIVENLFILLTMGFFAIPALTNTICKRVGIRRVLISAIYIIAISRLLIAFHLPNIWQTILSGVIVAVYGMFLSTFITLWVNNVSGETKIDNKVKFLAFSLLMAFLLDYLIRTIGFSQDISLLPPGLTADIWYITQYLWLIVQIPLTFGCIYFTRLYFPRFDSSTDLEDYDEIKRNSTVYSLIFIGMGAFWFLLFNIFLYPNIIAHYTATNYYINNIISIVALLAAILIIIRIDTASFVNLTTSIIQNVIILVWLVMFLFLGSLLMYVAVIMIAFTVIIFYLNFFVLLSHMATISFKWEKVKTISNAFAIGMVFYIIFTVFHIFATDWAYVVSAFKGFGPIIVLLAAIVLSFSTFISIRIHSIRRRA